MTATVTTTIPIIENKLHLETGTRADHCAHNTRHFIGYFSEIYTGIIKIRVSALAVSSCSDQSSFHRNPEQHLTRTWRSDFPTTVVVSYSHIRHPGRIQRHSFHCRTAASRQDQDMLWNRDKGSTLEESFSLHRTAEALKELMGMRSYFGTIPNRYGAGFKGR